MTAFSRIQLAAALLEYDNDNENPDAPNRSAHESAIFLPFRQNAENRRLIPRKDDYLGVSVAGEGGSAARSVRSNSALGHRQSRASISTLRNPFGPDDHLEDDNEHEAGELEVDLASWGLEAFIPKVKSTRNGKGKENSIDLASPHSVSSVPSHHPLTSHETPVTAPRRALGASRSMSVGGNLEYFGMEQGLSPIGMDDNRRRSIASPMATIGMEQPQILQRRRASSYSVFTTQVAYSPSPQSVPFPTTSISPNLEGVGIRSSSLAGRLEPPSMHERALSTASMDSKLLLKDDEKGSNSRQRTLSNATMATILLADDNPFALRPPSRSSRFDPKAAAHARTMSNASMGSRMLLDHDAMSVRTSQVPDARENRYSTTLELLRPKVLVMPSPLQPTAASPVPPNEKVRDGFLLSTDGPPLPPGARSSRRASAALSFMDTPPVASNSFTPNPLAALSLSQMTFRNTLKIGGQRDSFMDASLPRATVDGEQAQFEPEIEDTPIIAVSDVDEPFKTARPAGKLFGKSLIDDLESRKAQMRSKQRVFTGDERPSMMARRPNQRASTLIDPAVLQSRPVSQHMASFGPQGSQQALGRRNSANIKPLLNFDDDDKAAVHNVPGARLPPGRSVFGVDTLWEKEMIKLKEMEAREKEEEAERKLKEEAEGKKKKKKSKRKDKSKADPPAEFESLASGAAAQPRVSVEPPVLPDIPRANRRPPPQIPDDASESDESGDAGPSKEKTQSFDPNWHAVSSDDEEDGPRRTTGTGPRFPSNQRRRQARPASDSDDEVPLSVAISRASQKHTKLAPDSDDERPLSTLLQKKQSSLLNVNFDNLLPQSQGDDDNEPLGLRASRLAPSLHAQSQAGDIDDDDRPLALHPEQQRRSQFHMMAQQQQQQQFMMQAQMQNSMYFSPPSMMGSPFFGPSVMPMMMQAPMPVPSPPPMHDQAKFNRVDSWRRDVAVEGET
ncbi:hypothetical protein D9615_000401 [Tricholomella constricta]|uniref:Uncharacterized protein n=1 Tax=Tricholomella constricta TaxID=117010 RepID=A0A8H5HQA5_9AGAR|nr:hypothetical protein D9615_000401 [Tricholomella constricta]